MSKIPTLYGWLLGKRKLQLRAQLTAMNQGLTTASQDIPEISLHQYSMAGQLRSTDEVLEKIRHELGRSAKGQSNAA